MKKIILSLAVALVSMTSWAAKYSVDVNVNTQKVAVMKDGKLVEGTDAKQGSQLAVVSLEKKDGDVYASVKSIQGVPLPGLEACRVQKDGTISLYGLTYRDQRIGQAYRAAKAYLDKTSEPIEVTLYNE